MCLSFIRLASCAALVLASMLAPLTAMAQVSPPELVPRLPIRTGPVRAALPSGLTASELPYAFRLVVKFDDALLARATVDGGLASRSGADLGGVATLAEQLGLSFEPAIRLPEQELASLEWRAAQRSGRAQPDLAGMLFARSSGAELVQVESMGRLLADRPGVEFVHVQLLGVEPPGDIAPTTPDHTGDQGYHGADPGIDAAFAWAQGAKGAGVRISDCEFGWNPDHEDLVDIDIHLEPGQTIHPDVFNLGYDSHGTAALGELSAQDNGYGTSGLVPDASVYTYTEWSVEEGFRRLTAIAHALSDSVSGDIVQLEMQVLGAGGHFGPAELDPAVHTLVKAGTDAGVVVVAAAGNGDQDLDSPAYFDYASWGDSGAILVGAGTDTTEHDKLAFSTYGSRVNLHGWGKNVFTLGYGGITYGGDKHQRYTATFNGTSSALPLVTGACALVQQRATLIQGAPLGPLALRQLLIDTGVPQGPGPGGNIGPLPDLLEAFAQLGNGDPWLDLGGGTLGVNGQPTLLVAGPLTAGSDLDIGLSQAPAFAIMLFRASLSSTPVNAVGGTIYANPFDLQLILAADAGGQFGLTAPVAPGGVPGVDIYFQFIVQDLSVPYKITLSNAVMATTP
jgi:hypothetical protein